MQAYESEIQLDGTKVAQLAQRAVLRPLLRCADPQAAAQALQQAASADNHPVIAPTHIMVKGEQIIGYLSLGGLPTVQAWFDSQHKHATDSLKMIEHGETILRENGARVCAICCAHNSPFQPHMERLGFKLLGNTQVWIKEL